MPRCWNFCSIVAYYLILQLTEFKVCSFPSLLPLQLPSSSGHFRRHSHTSVASSFYSSDNNKSNKRNPIVMMMLRKSYHGIRLSSRLDSIFISNRLLGSNVSVGRTTSHLLMHTNTDLPHSEDVVVDIFNTNINTGIDGQLQDIECRARRLINCDINLNSPKQIAKALYNNYNADTGNTNTDTNTIGTEILQQQQPQGGGGTSKQILQQFAKAQINTDDNNDIAAFQKELALLVLEYRTLQNQKNKQESFVVSSKTPLPSSSSSSSTRTNAKTKTIQSTSFSTLTNDSATSTRIHNSNSNKSTTDVIDNTNTPLSTSAPASAAITLTFTDIVQKLFNTPSTKIHPYWQEPILAIKKPSARSLIAQLHPACPMGYDPTATPYGIGIDLLKIKSTTAGKKGSLLGYVREQKDKYPNVVIITRVGEFYEAFGMDAVLLVEHCGLNAMANKARAGCPLKNIQATLDGLTGAGFRVAVYEEANDYDNGGGNGAGNGGGGSKARIKNRMLAQIVSPASPTYLYDLVLGDSGSTRDALFATPAARPYVGIVHSAAGYAIVEVSTEERNVRVTERVTSEAVACRLASYPPAEPLFYVPSMGEEASTSSSSSSMGDRSRLPFLPSRWDTNRDGPGSKRHISVLPPSVYMPVPAEGVSDIQRFKQCIVSALLKTIEKGTQDSHDALTHEDFVVLSSNDNVRNDATFTNPLYVETASQLGLMADPTIPSLVNYLVPDVAPRPTRRFLRRWLLTPPPPSVASSMSNLVGYLKEDSAAMPTFEIPPIGKVLSLIRAGQASAQIFREVLVSLDSTVSIIDMCSNNEADSEIIHSLMDILRYESGMDASPENLKNRCLDAAQVIEEVVSPHDVFGGERSSMDTISSHVDDIIPPAFFERNELSWRGRIKPEASMDAYENVERAALALLQTVAIDFWGVTNFEEFDSSKKETRSPIVQDIFNNLIGLKAIPSWTKNEDKYYHPRDRNGKLLRNRYTTKTVEDAISSYVEACDNATNSVGKVLTDLSETLCDTGHLPAVTQAAHVNLILATACQHAAQANYLGWNLADIVEDDGTNKAACRFVDLHPYWMDNSVAVLNSFDLNGLFLLTAPNMSGKSTIMRSAAAAALLTNCGFCSPVGPGSFVKRFDSIFVRGASSDVPTENKSAFGAEMGDIAALLRACGEKSLVFVDELGRGTSPEDGTVLAGAVLEAMSSAQMNGFFATHLHSILDLPIHDSAVQNIVNKQMEISENGSDFRWTYKLGDGICKDSRALKTAAQFGIPPEIIGRAEEFSSHVKAHSSNKMSVIEKVTEPNTAHDTPKNEESDEALLSEVTMLVEEISGENTVIIPPRWSSPPSFEGSSVLYVLKVGQSFYVGETDSLSQRIRQHRSKGGLWSQSSTIAVKVSGGKSNARNLESRIIQKIAQNGFSVLSTTDGRKIKPRTK